MKKKTLLNSCYLFVLLLLVSSCKRELEIVVKDAKGLPYIGASIKISTQNIPEIEDYVAVSRQYYRQKDALLKFVEAGLTVEAAEKKVIETYNKRHEEDSERTKFPYLTNEDYTNHLIKYDKTHPTWEYTGTTNASGTVKVKLLEEEYFILIEDRQKNLTYYSSFYAHWGDTEVFTLK